MKTNVTSIALASLLLVFSEARAEEKTVEIKKNAVSFTGGSGNGGGDTDMDTDEDDVVPVEMTSDLKIDTSKNRVVLQVVFTCTEDGGDGTQLKMDKTQEVYTPPEGWTIKDITVSGNNNHVATSENLKCKGDEHGYNSFQKMPTQSYWDNASFKVDTSNDDDAPHIGVKGELSFKVVIEKK